jgi:hypothetical protein
LAGARGPVSISYRNLSSSLGARELASVRREFEAALSPGDGAAVEARVTLSENASQYLLVEEARKGEESQVWMAAWSRPGQAAISAAGPALEKKLIWEQDGPILDLAIWGSEMVVLAPSKLALYQEQGSRWQLRQTIMLSLPVLWPRDARGRVRVTGNRLQVFLPGAECHGEATDQLTLDCRPSSDPWVLESGAQRILLAHFAGDRNQFDGQIVLQDGSRQTIAPFYSAAAGEDAGGSFWVTAQVDGQAQVFDSAMEGVARFSSWGSDIVGVSAACIRGSQILATRPGESDDPDAIQAYSIVNGAAIPTGTPATFAGPVTALWPASAASALAVARDPATGKYAAYVVSLACNP